MLPGFPEQMEPEKVQPQWRFRIERYRQQVRWQM
jgi:hypothetical protein